MIVGLGDYCWIQQKQGLILAFFIPVGVMLSFNAVALMKTVLAIRKTREVLFCYCFSCYYHNIAIISISSPRQMRL